VASTITMHDQRRARALRGLHGLRAHQSALLAVAVQCQEGHRLASVYSTTAGLVYEACPDEHEHVDLLVAAPDTDDALPAACPCGHRTLSRDGLRVLVRAGVRVARVA
jgi:hypothetical protein